MQQSKYRGCINTAAVVSIPLRRFLCIRFESILQERKPNSLWLFSVRCRHIASDHLAVATWPSGGGHLAIGRCSRGHRAVAAGNFVKKTEITEERTKKAGVHLSHCQASAAPCWCEKEVGILRKKCTASCSRAYDPAIKSGKYSGHFHKKFSGQDNIPGVFRVFANSNNGKCAVRL